MEEKIMTLHPQRKKGVNILKRRYTVVKEFILKEVDRIGEPTYGEVSDNALKTLSATFDGKVVWYVVSVKLDLEARGILERVPKSSPHKIRRPI